MSRRAGYSLFEVLIAFAIMSMVLAVLLPRQTDLLTRAQNIDARLEAQDLALSHLALLGLDVPLEEGAYSEAQGDWTLHRDVTPVTLPDVDVPIVEVTITVHSERGQTLARLQEWRVLP
ncbi:prepilin-type N-terminal cleavage/methylation domain-containing protein [Thalassococcus sp. BH17M4-6]|uniref:prepilin-type N-terminal cleavage/methylation domain-containing protein n=1 Tax=Thalassococcus sp. BH17M4-6 TaxID=3413148 RepID=UPI003BC6DA63